MRERSNAKIKKLKATKLFASLEETLLGLEKSSTWDGEYFATKEDGEACLDRANYLACLQDRGSRTAKNQSKNYIDNLLDSLLPVDLDYAKTVEKQDQETKKLKQRVKKTR